MSAPSYRVWDHRIAPTPAKVGDTVAVKSWGIGARNQDVGRTGLVLKVNRTRLLVALTSGEQRTIHPDELRLLSRTIDRWCPTCKSARNERCRSVAPEPDAGQYVDTFHIDR